MPPAKLLIMRSNKENLFVLTDAPHVVSLDESKPTITRDTPKNTS
jgi:hypothetical protein